MQKTRVAINGFGRIGRQFFREAFHRPELEIVAINDLGSVEALAYLLQYDTAYGKADFTVQVEKDDSGNQYLNVNGYWVRVFAEKEPGQLPWGEHNIDIVVESTGFFVSYEKSKPHLDAGARRVVITAPVKDAPPSGINGATVLLGINEDALKTCDISSNASCTTNSASPVVQILHETIGIKKAMLNTTHAYTASQALVDGPSRGGDLRDGRAAAMNIVPSSTGAAIAVTKVITELEGKFDGISMRVPVVAGSMADVTFLASRPTTVEEINTLLKEAAQSERWNKTFAVTEEELVSSDIVGMPYGSIADLTMTRVVDGDLVKVCAWYDNEAGYVHTLVEHVIKSGGHIQ